MTECGRSIPIELGDESFKLLYMAAPGAAIASTPTAQAFWTSGLCPLNRTLAVAFRFSRRGAVKPPRLGA